MNIPTSLADAARIDGCGPLRYLTHILIPMSWNTIGALAVIQFVYAWDQYIWPLVIMQKDDKQVVQVGLRKPDRSGRSDRLGRRDGGRDRHHAAAADRLYGRCKSSSAGASRSRKTSRQGQTQPR